MSVPYWPNSLPQGPMIGLDFAPKDVKAAFAADTGEPISRPRTTGAPFMARAQFTLKDGQIATFREFYADTLAQGSQRFAWRDVTTGELRLWRFMGAYSRQFLTKRVARVEAELMMLPGVPWFSPYGLEGLSTVPAFVADYESDVYGIDGKRIPASDLPTIEGTYLVRRRVVADTVDTTETLVAGDVPATAPTNTLITRRNLLNWSEAFDNSVWLRQNSFTVDPNVANSPNGALTADRINFAALVSSSVRNNTVIPAGTYVFSVWLRSETGTEPVTLTFFNSVDGSSEKDVTATTTWQRFSINAVTTADTQNWQIRTNDSTAARSVLAWGAQVEQGVLTPYQKTEASDSFDTYDSIVGYPV